MIPNCEGYKIELEEFFKFIEKDELFFAGSGLFEKGHLLLALVDKKGTVVVY